MVFIYRWFELGGMNLRVVELRGRVFCRDE